MLSEAFPLFGEASFASSQLKAGLWLAYWNMESRSFPFSFDIAGGNAEHRTKKIYSRENGVKYSLDMYINIEGKWVIYSSPHKAKEDNFDIR